MASRDLDLGAVEGTARVSRRTKDLVKRLRPGDVAVIDHVDLDRVAGEGLVEAAPSAVVNAAPSISGRYPNEGPLLLVRAGIPLLDDVGDGVLEAVADGAPVRLEGDRLVADGFTATGRRQTEESVLEAMDEARASMGAELERFAENTLEYMVKERHLVLDTPEVPEVRTPLRGRHVLIVVRGHDYRNDLAALRQGGYLQEMRPVLVGVDGGADAILEMGGKPDIIIGDFDSVSERALRSGAQLIVHAYPGGRAPGAERLEELGVPYSRFEAPGTSEDIAMLLAYEKGAELIVAVGTHSSMVEFLDKGRRGMASTFLVRLRVGPILVDAKGVSRLYRNRLRKRDMALLVLSALFTLLVVTAVSQPARLFLENLWNSVELLFG